MSESNNTQAKKTPTHYAYHVTERASQKYWTRIGVAWQHRDEKGFNIVLECTPVDGHITVRIAAEDQGK